ncbi:MAG: DUF262 domain-containing protein [Candidatus Cybelea sp.]
MKPHRTSYTALDFVQFKAADALDITPKFQRRGVWKNPARSYLIETLILGLPVPAIYLRVRQNQAKTKTIREVVDGQQRISAILDFVAGDYKLSKVVGEAYRDKSFEDLADSDQDAIRGYPFSCEVLQGVSDADVLKIFARVNINSIRLNAQELRNGTYFGFFKQSCYSLALEHIEFWRKNKIASETSIARMQEVELTSELLIAMIAGMQDKKKSIDTFYRDYDQSFPGRIGLEKRLRQTVDLINDAAPNLAETEFHRKPLFYSLFLAIYHRRFGLLHTRLHTPRTSLTTQDLRSVKNAVLTLSNVIARAKKLNKVPSRYEQFVDACLSQTDNIEPRRRRFSEIYRAAFD